MKHTYLILAALSAAITGCVSAGQPVAVGKDTYYVAATGPAMAPSGDLMVSALAKANAFCAADNKKMMVDHTQALYRTSEIYFVCVSDDKYHDVHLRSEPNIRVENAK